MIVADASVVYLAVAMDNSIGSSARRRLAGEAVRAPHLLDVETIHALRTNVRRRILDAERAARAVDDLGRSTIRRVSHRRLLPRMWELRDNISAYDAAYVALAEALGVPLVTADARIAGAPGIRCDVEVVGSAV